MMAEVTEKWEKDVGHGRERVKVLLASEMQIHGCNLGIHQLQPRDNVGALWDLDKDGGSSGDFESNEFV